MTLKINTTATQAEQTYLQIAFDTRHTATWNLPVSKYGFGCKTIDEVLTHIRFDELTGNHPHRFSIRP